MFPRHNSPQRHRRTGSTGVLSLTELARWRHRAQGPNSKAALKLTKSRVRPNKSLSTSLTTGVRSVAGGRITFARAMREAFRRGRASVNHRRERAMLDELASQPARLRPEFQSLSASDLLKHFRDRTTPQFFPGFELAENTAHQERNLLRNETQRLIDSAWLITREHRWPLLGFGEQEFGQPINWQRDPLSERVWPLDYHGDIPLWHNDGSDIRVLWELNRLGHLITLGHAYALTKEHEFARRLLALPPLANSERREIGDVADNVRSAWRSPSSQPRVFTSGYRQPLSVGRRGFAMVGHPAAGVERSQGMAGMGAG